MRSGAGEDRYRPGSAWNFARQPALQKRYACPACRSLWEVSERAVIPQTGSFSWGLRLPGPRESLDVAASRDFIGFLLSLRFTSGFDYEKKSRLARVARFRAFIFYVKGSTPGSV
jgi:hypothetical protein